MPRNVPIEGARTCSRDTPKCSSTRALPAADGKFAYNHALRAEELARKADFRALSDLKAALLLETGPQPASLETAADADVDADVKDAFGLTSREREVLALVASGNQAKHRRGARDNVQNCHSSPVPAPNEAAGTQHCGFDPDRHQDAVGTAVIRPEDVLGRYFSSDSKAS